MKHRNLILYKIAIMFTILTLGQPQFGNAATTYDDVYQITDLSNRGMDVILRKSKGAKQPLLPKWQETSLNRYHVYQLQVACLDEIRRMQSTFKMTPYPHIIVSPGSLSEKNLYRLSTIILTEIRRIAIHLNIWGLPKQKRSFSGEKANDIFEETVALYLKLRVLGGRENMPETEVSAEFGRTVADLKILLNSIDPARRYHDVFPPTPKQNTNQSFASCLAIRKEFNGIRSFYKLRKIAPPKPNKKTSQAELYLQSQIILGEINQIKTAIKATQPAPPVPEPATENLASQLTTLIKLIDQIKPLAAMNKKGGK
jgi:hypothetical protein